ncbi:MAG TPA: ATP-binding cassette domain-containing protein [Acidimicrobiia bacterium]|nr:ATP-binding cassette domain-containing protein [Acidimicrobiia bacterium]
MTKLLTLVISGAVSGGIYAIIAAGLVLTYQTSGIFNFGHGAVAFTTAMVYFELHSPDGGGWPIVPAAVVAILVFAPLLGLALDRLLLRRLATAPVYARVMGTIGLLVALPQLALWVIEQGNEIFRWDLPSTDQIARPPGLGPAPAEVVWRPLEGVTINSDQVAVFLAAAVTALLLWFVLRRTRIGLSMRAAVDRRDLARLRGIDTDRASAVAWVLSMVLAGLAGVLLAPFLELADFSFTSVVLGSIVAVVVARFRSIPVAFGAGLLFGVVQNLIFGYTRDLAIPWTQVRPLAFLREISGFNSAIPYILAFLALLVLGQVGGRAAGTVAESEAPPPDHRVGVPAWRRRLPWLVAAGALVWWVQFVADDYWASQVSAGLALSLVFLSFVVVTGLGGMVSLAQAMFVTTGGFVAGWLVNKRFDTDIPVLTNDGRPAILVAALAAAVAAAAVGLLIALPVRRLGQLELALATLALAFVGELVVFQVDEIGNGSTGYFLDPPQLGRFDFGDPRAMSMLLLALVALVSLFINNLQRSASGRAMLAVRSSEVAARTAGISPVRSKLALFAVSAGIAGLGGSMFAVVNSPFSYRSAPALIGLIWLAVTVLFGIRRPGGAIIAGLFFSLFPEFLATAAGYSNAPWTWIPDSFREAVASSHFAPILFGLGAINLAQNPDGVLAIAGQERLEKRRKRMERRATRRAGAGYPGAGARPTMEEELLPIDASAALQLQDIGAGYGEVEVLHGVDLVVAPGQAVTLLGANGAGKSTLCAVAAGLLAPTRGRVVLAGDDVTSEPPFRRARRGLLLVPEARGLFPGLSVEENLAILLRGGEERRQAYERFPILGQRRKQVAGLLSGGEQQMLGLAPALARPPQVLIADEPTLGLAPLAAEQVAAALAELRDRGVALLLVEEKAREALALADTVAVMELGRIVWTGPREEADADRLTEAYLGVARV